MQLELRLCTVLAYVDPLTHIESVNSFVAKLRVSATFTGSKIFELAAVHKTASGVTLKETALGENGVGPPAPENDSPSIPCIGFVMLCWMTMLELRLKTLPPGVVEYGFTNVISGTTLPDSFAISNPVAIDY